MDNHYKITPADRPYDFGGEAYLGEGISLDDYGIDFGPCTVSGLTGTQLSALACSIVDHLMLCGHRFEIRKTGEQDQRERLTSL